MTGPSESKRGTVGHGRLTVPVDRAADEILCRALPDGHLRRFEAERLRRAAG